jgi:uncharacterized protein (DUF58 family)
MRVRLRLNNWLLPILLLAALSAQIFDPSRVWKIVIVGLGSAWVVGWFWARGLARGLRMTREMRFGWAQVGDELEERFTLINDSAFAATWVEIEDHSTLPDYHASLATTTGGHGEATLIVNGACTRRGLYMLGDTSLLTGDPLGIYSVRIDDPTCHALLVLPPVVPLPNIDVTPGGYLGESRPRLRTLDETVRASSVREYAPGDPLRRIHWPTSAKHNKLYTRQFDSSPAGDWWLLLDLDRRIQTGQGWDSTEEYSIVLAASLIDRGQRSKHPVGLAINGAAACWLPPRDNERQRWELLHALALAHPGDLSLKDFLERGSKSFGKNASLVIITASTETDWIDALAPLIWRGMTPTVLLLEAASFGAPGNSLALSGQLQHMGISNHIITRDLLNRPEARPGHSGKWEWRQSKITGKVIATHRPDNLDWRKLT